jgi:uncharacterized protein (TIRG00374 family)
VNAQPQAPARPKKLNWRGLLSTGLRILVTLAMLFYLYRTVPWSEAGSALRAANLLWLLLSAALFFMFLLVSNWRWQVLLNARGLHFTFGYLLKVYFVAWMFNNVLPTSIGGDVARIAYTVKDRRAADAFAVTLVDRIIGFIGLFFFALVASLLLLLRYHQNPSLGGLLGDSQNASLGRISGLALNVVGFVVLVLITLTIFSDTMHRLVVAIFGRVRLLRLGERIDRLYDAVKVFRKVPGALFLSFLSSLVIQLTLALVWYFTALSPAQGAGGHPMLLYYCLGIPLVGIATMLPSIGGLGIRENGIVMFFTAAWMTGAMSKGQATATALLYLIVTVVYALAGFAVFQSLKKTSGSPTPAMAANRDEVISQGGS